MDNAPFEALWNKLPQHRKDDAKAMMERTLNDIDIQAFLTKYDLHEDNDFIKRNILKFKEYLKIRDADEWYTAELKLFDNNVTVSQIPRSERLKFKLETGQSFSAKATYDRTTSAFEKSAITKSDITMYNAKAIEFIKNFIELYKNGKNPKGMWLYGEMGVGKSHLMGALVNRLVKSGISAKFLSMNQLVNDCREKMNYSGENLEKFIWKIKKDSEVLILDDLGTEQITNWTLKQIIYDIFDYRMNNKLPTFVTSNLSILDYVNQVKTGKDVIAMDAKRLEERLTTLMPQIQMGGENRRQKEGV